MNRALVITRKGGKIVTIPLAPTARVTDLAIGERSGGPAFARTDGRRLDRHGAGRILRRIARRAGIIKPIGPHTLRPAFITAALGALAGAGEGDSPRRHLMTDPSAPRHVEIKDGDQTVAAAEVTTSPEPGGTVQASLHAASGHLAPGSRASLVDAVMDLPEVQASEHLTATVPLGDGESLQRLRERTDDTTTRPAGSTALVDAKIPPDDEPGSGQEPGETSSS